MSCGQLHMHSYADYLEQSLGREDHDAIAKKMGAPHRTIKLDKGGDLWTYEYCPTGRMSNKCLPLWALTIVFSAPLGCLQESLEPYIVAVDQSDQSIQKSSVTVGGMLAGKRLRRAKLILRMQISHMRSYWAQI